ncbi:MAG: GTPase HflX [Methanomassiliicoccales archaeon]|jgi:GTP-binding protein HflX|nr:GTPase HflX [Methanomassiliicoccales archaeon]
MSWQTAAIITTNEKVAELEELAASAGYEVIYEIIQRRNIPDSSTFIGKGKIDEVRTVLRCRAVDTIIVNGDLKPSQQYNLERMLNIKCIDRVSLVLEIFASRANSKEAKLQVEKARLKYEIPFIRDWIHRTKKGERAGHFSSGDYEAAVYYDLIKKRIRKIDDELKKLRENNLYIGFKKKIRPPVVSLAGYTNAGKSSLFISLTKKDTIVEPKMFSTLKPLRGRIANIKEDLILIDTIGFLDNLPVFLIESFRNTIDEIFAADLVLLVLDISDPISEIERKLNASMKILLPDVDFRKVVVVLNKIDKLDSLEVEERMRFVSNRIQSNNIVAVSASTKAGIESLIERIKGYFEAFDHLKSDIRHVTETSYLAS